MNKNLWIVGTGTMAREYAKVLNALGREFTAVGRSQKNADNFTETTGAPAIAGGINKVLSEEKNVPERAIVAVNVDQLSPVVTDLMKAGVRKILVEKPGFCNPDELDTILSISRETDSQVAIAYNRRFYASVLAAEKIISDDGGLRSMHFEFTEWERSVTAFNRPREIFENWFYANSTHVVDLAFFMAGSPVEMTSMVAGKLEWHTPAIFTGTGKTSRDVLFSYCANWNAPGRWGVELLTPLHRLYLKPMEQLQIQELYSVKTEPVAIDDSLDRDFKPGLYRQTEAFLADDFSRLCTLADQSSHVKTIYKRIVNGGTITG